MEFGKKTKVLTTIAILTALSVVFSLFFTFRVGTFLKFSPVFIAVALAAKAYGVTGGVLVAVMSDFIQYLMFPSNGFSVGIFISNVLLGLVFGIFLHNDINFKKILSATLISQTVCTVLIPTLFWVYIEKWYPTIESIIYWRILQALIMFVLMIIVFYLIFIKSSFLKKLGF